MIPFTGQRFNSFNLIHKGLRALLFETGTVIMRTDFSNEEEGRKAVELISDVTAMFNDHAANEDQHVLPAVARFDESLQEEFEEEHEEDEELANKLSWLCDAYVHALTTERKMEIGRDLLYIFYEFTAFNLYHMNKEEEKLNRALWANYTDEEIMAIQQKIVSSIPPAIMAVNAKWMLRGINDVEVKGWLGQVKATAPEPAFRALIAQAETELSAIRWEKLAFSLADTAASH